MFNVGDKVRLRIPARDEWIGDAVGKVIQDEILLQNRIYIQWDVPVCIMCGKKHCNNKISIKWHMPSDIKYADIRYAVRKNEQLMFAFMQTS